MKRIFVIILAISLVTAGISLAGDSKQGNQDNKEIRQVAKELEQTRASLAKLNNLVEQWHRACLDTDEKKIHQYEQAIYNFIISDINASFRAVQKAENEAGESRDDWRSGEETRREATDEYRDFVKLRKILSSKEGVLFRLKNSDSFSLKYRLLAEYRGLIREELGMSRWELAEDLRELKNDK
ncbi:MAG: hypothetical protein AB1483_01880 [Candidatus Zixiibacteriota bacterium]